MTFFISSVLSISLVAMTVLFHYEGLRFLSVGAWSMRMNPRMEMQFIILCIFVLHIFEIAVWGLSYFIGAEVLGLGSFGGNHAITANDFIYFSVETYTSLGYGDIFPTDALRLLAGFECLDGLLLMGWSASFTFLQMQLYWVRHKGDGNAVGEPETEPEEEDEMTELADRVGPRRRRRRQDRRAARQQTQTEA